MEQLDIFQAEQRRDAGIESSAAHSDDVTPYWTTVGVAYVRAYARHHDLFLCEQVREYAETRRFPRAFEPRAWGKVMRRAAREKIVEAFGYAPSNSSNRSPKVLWRSLVRPV